MRTMARTTEDRTAVEVLPTRAEPGVARIAAAVATGPAVARAESLAPSIRLTTRGRLVLLAGVVAVLTGLGVGGMGAVSAEAGQPGAAVALAEHTVAPGETLWHIASAVTTSGQDVRDTVTELQRINGLRGSTLLVGQQILVPQG